MWNKIYYAVLAAAVVVMCFLTFYARTWLGSIGSPNSALEGYEFYAGLGSTFLWISSAVLLILANIILWYSRLGWAMWTTLGYFAIFVILRTFWLEKTRYVFQNSDSLFFTPVVGVILIIAAGVLVFLNQFINLRLNEKMYPPAEMPVNIEVPENHE
jgi:uncharacterized membrane protein SirB2